MEKSSVGVDSIQCDSNLDDYDASPKAELELNVGGRGATQRRLWSYQVCPIESCSGIGTGLFVGTGAAYAKRGPAGLDCCSRTSLSVWCCGV